MTRATILCLVLLSVGAMGTTLALAHGGATGVVKQRMDLMEGIGTAMKRLADIFKGKVDYDAEAVKAAAGHIRDHAGERITALFPEGSLDKPTEALPAIWQDWAEFEALAEQLAAHSDALVAAADRPRADGPAEGQTAGGGMVTDRESVPSTGRLSEMPPQAVFLHLARNCRSCHTRFRIED